MQRTIFIITGFFLLSAGVFTYTIVRQRGRDSVQAVKRLTVSRVNFSSEEPNIAEISETLDTTGKEYAINTLSWKEYNYRPVVKFRIAYDDNAFYLKYYVREKYVRAVNTESNGSVWEDSCVEFFISPSDDGIYYNFEFNCIGTRLLGWGKSREARNLVDPAIIEKIKTISTLGTEPFNEKKGGFLWELTVKIPFEIFVGHKIRNLEGKTLTANFYKCGDKLTEPHYLSWNKIETPRPDFHRPEYFGELQFR